MSENKLTIEEGLPLPEKGQRRMSGTTEVMRRLKVGDSFLSDPANRANLFSIARAIGIKISTRLTEDRQNIRVWRIEDEAVTAPTDPFVI